MRKRMKKLVLILGLSLCFFASAQADDVHSGTELVQALTKANGTARLTGDITLTQTITIDNTATLDLNGKELKLAKGNGDNAGLLRVASNGNLTILDNSQPNVNKGAGTALSPAMSASDAVNFGKPASYANGVLTWYVTESTASADKTRTTEKTYVYASDAPGNGNKPMGRIISDDVETAVEVNGGKVTLSGGAVFGFTKRAVRLSNSAVMNMTGGYLLGNSADMGAAVYANNSSLNISGGVISGNQTGTENASWIDENTYYGGAVCLSGSSAGSMTGGYLTQNWAKCGLYFDGGGALLIRGTSTFDLKGGYLTGNRSNSGGGAIRTGWKNGATLMMNGGYVSGNVAVGAEGGGISVNQNGTGFITKGFITNNVTLSQPHWGGGGLFCSDGSWLVMEGTLVMDNHAGGCGGGIAGCSTGRIDTESVSIIDHGVAIFDNSADGLHFSGDGSTKDADHQYAKDSAVFMNNGYEDYFCALSSHVADTMLGGGYSSWKGSADGQPITVTPGGVIDAAYVAGLTSSPTQQAKDAAINKLNLIENAVIVSGNSAYTHGGGILCNGYLVFQSLEGREIEIGDRMELSGLKHVLDEDGKAVSVSDLAKMKGQFSFEIIDRNNQVVSRGTNNEKGEIIFDRMLPFNAPGTYVYTIKETDPAGQIVKDGAEYRLTVVVRANRNYYQDAVLNVVFNQIKSVKIEKRIGVNGQYTTVFEDTNANSSDNSAYVPRGQNGEFRIEFSNYLVSSMDVTVKKVWEGQIARPQSLTVYLMRGNTRIEEKALNAENGWTYTWSRLPVSEEEYTVAELLPEGYEGTIKRAVNSVEHNGVTRKEYVFTITNKPVKIDTMKVEVSKVWDGEGEHPVSITVYLLENGTRVKEAVLNADNNWTHVWDNLDPEKEYTVAEVQVEGYTGSVQSTITQQRNPTDGTDYYQIVVITNKKKTQPTPIPTPKVTPVPPVHKLPKTGDSTNLFGLFLVLAVSAGLSMGLIKAKRKA